MVGELVDIEEDRLWNVSRNVSGAGIDRGNDAGRRKRGVQDDDAGIVESAGEPGGCDERIHGDQLSEFRCHASKPTAPLPSAANPSKVNHTLLLCDLE
jgi:hypothetical protein